MLKNFLLSAGVLSLFTLLFTGCNDFNGKYYTVLEFEPNKNEVIIEYRSDKIAIGYFQPKVEEYCAEQHKHSVVNYVKNSGKNLETVSFSCLLDN